MTTQEIFLCEKKIEEFVRQFPRLPETLPWFSYIKSIHVVMVDGHLLLARPRRFKAPDNVGVPFCSNQITYWLAGDTFLHKVRGEVQSAIDLAHTDWLKYIVEVEDSCAGLLGKLPILIGQRGVEVTIHRFPRGVSVREHIERSVEKAAAEIKEKGEKHAFEVKALVKEALTK